MGNDDLEDPLPEGQVDSFTDRFEEYYKFALTDGEILCESLLGRLKREIDRKQQALMKCENARSMRETARTAAGKRLRVATDVTINIATKSGAKGPRAVSSNYIYIALLELVLIGGYALVGCFVPPGKSERYAPLSELRDYLAFVKKVALPLNRSPPPLHKVVRADEDTRALWAKHMRKGLTMGEAIRKSEPKQAAFWLWSGKDETVGEAELADDGTETV